MSAIFAASFFLAQSNVAQEPITLLYQPKIGSTYKNTITMTQSGQLGESSTTTKVTTKVLSFDQGFYKLEATSSDSTVAQGANEKNTTIKAPEKPSIMFLDQHYQPKPDAGASSSDAQQMMSGMSKAFSGVLFPAKPVAIGEAWTNSIDFGALMGVVAKDSGVKSTGNLKLTYKLAKIDATEVTISTTIAGTVNMDVSGAGGAEGMKIPMTFSGGGTSTIEKVTGIPLTNNMKMNMKMEVAGQTMEFAMTIVIKPE